MQTFRVGGAGGQHKDKTSAGVRIVHRPSGAIGQASDDRSQHKNKRTAFVRMAESPRFRSWADQSDTLPPIEDEIARELGPENLKVEVRKNGSWTEVPTS